MQSTLLGQHLLSSGLVRLGDSASLAGFGRPSAKRSEFGFSLNKLLPQFRLKAIVGRG